MSKNSHAILFVHIGATLPPWLGDAVTQARIFNDCPVYLAAAEPALAEARFPSGHGLTSVPLETIPISEKQKVFRRISPMDRNLGGGFWNHTTERFFVIEGVIRLLNLSNVVHLENDVLLYCDLEDLVPKLAKLYSGATATFINDALCVPGLVFIPDIGAAARLTRALVTTLEAAIRSPHFSSQPGYLNDMSLLGMMRDNGAYLIDHLPIVPSDYPVPLQSAAGQTPAEAPRFSQHCDALGYIFDGAALGQFLGGVDPRTLPQPTVGYINQYTVFDPRLLNPRMTTDEAGRKIPIVKTPKGITKIANLHMHSKNLRPFLSA